MNEVLEYSDDQIAEMKVKYDGTKSERYGILYTEGVFLDVCGRSGRQSLTAVVEFADLNHIDAKILREKILEAVEDAVAEHNSFATAGLMLGTEYLIEGFRESLKERGQDV